VIRFRAAALSIACLAAPTRAKADAGAPREVELVIAADARGANELELVARELLGRLAVKVEVARVDAIDLREVASPPRSARPWLARVWVDLHDPSRATLYLHDPAHDRLFVRQVARTAGGEELAREELGHILETCAEGLLSGANVGLPRGEVAPLLSREKEEPAPPPLPRTRAWNVGAYYEGAAFSSQARLTHGPVLAAAVRAPLGGLALGAWVTWQYRFPVEIDTPTIGARWATNALRALATLELASSTATTWRFGLGGGFDVVRVEPKSNDGRFVLEPGTTLIFGLVRAAVGVHVRVGAWTSVGAALAADVDPSATSYVVAARDGDRVVLRPWPVRPSILVGVDVP
jgi:hypothetical protein